MEEIFDEGNIWVITKIKGDEYTSTILFSQKEVDFYKEKNKSFDLIINKVNYFNDCIGAVDFSLMKSPEVIKHTEN